MFYSRCEQIDYVYRSYILCVYRLCLKLETSMEQFLKFIVEYIYLIKIDNSRMSINTFGNIRVFAASDSNATCVTNNSFNRINQI